MTNVNSSAVRHALNQTTAAREAIGYFIQRILQQFNNVNHMLFVDFIILLHFIAKYGI